MPTRYLRHRVAGVTFVFAYDAAAPELLHIWARHRKEPKQANWAWFTGQHVWNDTHARFEGEAGEVGIHWFWINFEEAVVMVSSCFKPFEA